MFNLFKKKEEKPQELLCWQKPKAIEASSEIDKFVNGKKLELIEKLASKVGIEDIDIETLAGISCWAGPDTTTGYGLLIYIGTSIMDKLSNIEKLLKSNAQSNDGNN